MTNKLQIANSKIQNQGFTLMELLIVIGIIVFLSVILLPISLNFYQSQILNKTTDQLVWFLKQARSNALSQMNNFSFGLYFDQKQIVLFQGESYQARQIDQDLNLPIPNSIKISGLEEIVFAKATGLPNQSAKITLSSEQGTREIQVNEIGLISY